MDTQKEQHYKEQMLKALQLIKQLRKEVDVLKNNPQNEDIAIIGMACRFPGGVVDLDSYWNLLVSGVNAITDIPLSRWNIEKYYSQGIEKGKMYCRKGGFVENVEFFDANFFDISPREALSYDPNFRLLLEVAWEALENAGMITSQIKNTLSSVVVGQAVSDYEQRHLWANDLNKIDMYSATGSVKSVGSGRISYLLDLQGSNFSVETGSSASSVALHLACQSLKSEEVDLALVGGTSVITEPNLSIALSQMGALSPDGYCKTFDESANGFVPSDGCAVVILKRLSDAVKNKDNIWAIIKGSAINHVGRSNGPTAPSTKSQIKVIQQALKSANLSPEKIDFVEAHGTGTPLGDPIEMEAIQQIYGKTRSSDNPIYVGSVNTNIGHTEGAAGLAGLIKAVLAIHHKQIPKNLHFHKPSPHINWNGNIKIPTELTEWKKKGLRLAATSSFGLGGTNAHVIVQEVSPEIREAIAKKTTRTWHEDILAISAKTPQAIKTYVQKYIDFLKNTPNEWTSVCAAAALHRTHFAYRLAINTDLEQALQQLESFVQNDTENTLTLESDEEAKVVFVFPWQGSQWIGMGKELYAHSPIFKQSIDECEKAFSQFVSWSLVEELHKTESENRYQEIDVIQPVLIAMEIALAKLWQSVGVLPNAVVGHSMGETAAAYISGTLSLEDAARIICRRSQLMKKLSGKGAMLLVELTVEEAQEAIQKYQSQVSVAVSNSPQNTVLSGDTATIHTIMESLESQNVFCRLVKVNVASHSPQMDEIKDDLLSSLAEIKPQIATIPFYSTVLSQMVEGTRLTPDYWVDNLRKPVMFGKTIENLLEDQHTVFIEMTPHPVLLVQIQQIIQNGEWKALAVPSLYRDKNEIKEFGNSITKLYTSGYPLDWTKIYTSAAHIALPTYPWQKKRYWLDSEETEINTSTSFKEKIEEKLEAKSEQVAIDVFFKKKLAAISGYVLTDLDENQKLAQMGIDSMMLTQIRKSIEKEYRVDFSTKDFWKYPSIKQFSHFLKSLQNASPSHELPNSTNKWIEKPIPRPNATLKLFCFHHSGASAQTYFTWAALLPQNIELNTIQLTGRAERMDEAHFTNIDELLEVLVPIIRTELDKKFVFFGHSMGGMLAFALTRSLRASNLPLPQHLFISASPYLPTYTGKRHHRLSDQELQSIFTDITLENFGGDQEYFQMVFRTLKADLALANSFEHLPENPLDLPITVFGADQDFVIPYQGLEDWQKETTQNFDFILRKGEHHYIANDAYFITQTITQKLL